MSASRDLGGNCGDGDGGCIRHTLGFARRDRVTEWKDVLRIERSERSTRVAM